MHKKMQTKIMSRTRFRLLVLAAALVGSGTPLARADVTYSELYTLHLPAGFTSFSQSVHQVAAGGQVVLSGSIGSDVHALLWSGPGDGAVDLSPTGFTYSIAYATNGTWQVGFGTNGFEDNALLWSGTAQSCINLQNVLPTTFRSSDAYSISGNTVYGIATDTNGNYHAIAWTISVPEPASLSLITIAGLGLLRRREIRE